MFLKRCYIIFIVVFIITVDPNRAQQRKIWHIIILQSGCVRLSHALKCIYFIGRQEVSVLTVTNQLLELFS